MEENPRPIPYFATFDKMLRALHDIEAGITEHARTLYRMNLDREVGSLAIEIREKLLPQIKRRHRESFDVLPAHAISTLCLQLAKSITMHPKGNRKFPDCRPLEATRIRYDYDKMYIKRITDRPDEIFFGSITLPKSGFETYIIFNSFNFGAFGKQVPPHAIKWANLAYKTNPMKTALGSQEYALVVAFDPNRPETVPQRVGRKPIMMQEVAMMFNEGKTTGEIAAALKITIRAVQKNIKLLEQSGKPLQVRRRAKAPVVVQHHNAQVDVDGNPISEDNFYGLYEPEDFVS
jgi:hypothetical protein